MSSKFELFKGVNNQWYFNLVATNGKVIASSEGYTQKRGALKGIRAVKSCALKAKVITLDK